MFLNRYSSPSLSAVSATQWSPTYSPEAIGQKISNGLTLCHGALSFTSLHLIMKTFFHLI